MLGHVLAWTVAVVAAGAAVLLTVLLVRRRRSTSEGWSVGDLLTALGIVIGLLVGTLPLLVQQGGAARESPEEARYRQAVRAACSTMGGTGNPFAEAFTAAGGIDPARLARGLRRQFASARSVLEPLWVQVPASLSEPAREAREATSAYFTASERPLDELARRRDPMAFPEVVAWMGEFEAQLRARQSAVEASMSVLAGQPCSAPTPASSPTA